MRQLRPGDRISWKAATGVLIARCLGLPPPQSEAAAEGVHFSYKTAGWHESEESQQERAGWTLDCNPSAWTVGLLHDYDCSLWAICAGCRVERRVPLDAFPADRRIEPMRFRCKDCGGSGHALVRWIGNGDHPQRGWYDFGSGDAKNKLPFPARVWSFGRPSPSRRDSSFDGA